MDAGFEAIRTELLQMDAALQRLTQNQFDNAPEAVYQSHLEKLNHLAASPVKDVWVQRLTADDTLTPVITRLSRLKRENGARMEIRFAESVARAPDPWDRLAQFVYFPNYLALARMEQSGPGLNAGDRVVFLGSGPLPMSLICLYKQYGIQGVGIEQDERRAALSERVLQRLELSRHIQILCGNHFTLPKAGPCSLIMVGADAMPKAEIFTHLAAILKPGEMITYRIYEKGLRRLFDVASSFDLPPEFVELGRIQPEPPVNNTVVFAVRGGGSVRNRDLRRENGREID